MSRAIELVIAILICLFLVALSVTGFIYSAMDKRKMRMEVCFKQIIGTLDIWVSSVCDLTKKVECDEAVALCINQLAEEYFKYKKSRDYPSKVHCLNEIYAQLLLVEGYSPFGNDLELTFETYNRIEVIAKEYNKCATELNDRLERELPRFVGKVFHIKKAEHMDPYFEEMYR